MGIYCGEFSGFFLRLCKMLGMIKKTRLWMTALGFCESFVGSIFIVVAVVDSVFRGTVPSSSK